MTGMGVVPVLLYSAVFWEMLFGFVFQGDRINIAKLLALILALSGIVLIGQVYDFEKVRLSSLDLLAGLGAGLGYAAYILINKRISQYGYSTLTVIAYGLGIGALVLLLLQKPMELRHSLANPTIMVWLVILGIVSTMVGGLAFYAGLQRLPAVNASTMATLEPVVATTLGWIIFSERLDLPQIIDGILVVGSVILIQLPRD
jgi:drug/metabolite transporter (DMT)-like permease